MRLSVTVGFRGSQNTNRPHPASLPVRVPAVVPLLRASFSLASRRPPCVSLQLSSLSLATAFKWLVSAHAGHTGSGLVRDGLRSGTKTGQPGCIWCNEAAGFCCRFPAVRGQVRSYENREIAGKRSVARSHTTRFCPKGVGGLVRDGLRSGTKTGQPGCIWCNEAAGFCCRFLAVRGQVRSYEKREIPDKRSVARSAHTTRFCPKGVGADLSAMGCEAEPKPANLVVSGATRRLAFAAGSRQFADKSAPTKNERSRASEASPRPVLRLRPAQSTISIREGCIGRVARREVFISRLCS